MTYEPTWERKERHCGNCDSAYTPAAMNQKYCCTECLLEYNERNLKQVGRFRILERDNFRCIYCGKSSVENATELHVDHVIPRVAGGDDIASNLVTSCKYCNVQKQCRIMSKENTMRILAEVEKRNLAQGVEPLLTIKLQS